MGFLIRHMAAPVPGRSSYICFCLEENMKLFILIGNTMFVDEYFKRSSNFYNMSFLVSGITCFICLNLSQFMNRKEHASFWVMLSSPIFINERFLLSSIVYQMAAPVPGIGCFICLNLLLCFCTENKMLTFSWNMYYYIVSFFIFCCPPSQ